MKPLSIECPNLTYIINQSQPECTILTVPSINLMPMEQRSLNSTVHRGAFFQFPFRWIYYYGSNESNGKETRKTHLCAPLQKSTRQQFCLLQRWVSSTLGVKFLEINKRGI